MDEKLLVLQHKQNIYLLLIISFVPKFIYPSRFWIPIRIPMRIFLFFFFFLFSKILFCCYQKSQDDSEALYLNLAVSKSLFGLL